uniref:DNA 5'-3' helicase n=1 Tax=viral metagenome TaxID=1070528 RepID=A0A6H2A1E2_9ZZZZ
MNEVPKSIETEEATLGCILLGGVLPELEPSDFYTERGQLIYAACQSVNVINQITVAQELHRQKQLELAGGAAYLSHLISITPTPLDLPEYAAILRRYSQQRKLITVAEQISALGRKGGEDILSEADKLLLELRKESHVANIITPEDRAELLNTRYTELYTTAGGIALSTGLKDLDYSLGGGFFAGDLVVLGARPSVGKTTLLQNIANNLSYSHKILFMSAEMNVEGLTDRDVAGITQVRIDEIRRGGYKEETYLKILGEGLTEIQKRQIYYYDETPITTAKIDLAATQMKLRQGLDLVIVDYLGLLDDTKGENQNVRIGIITRNLKHIARKLDVPIVVACQLSRHLEMKENKIPNLQDLRDSGNIEQDADVVLFLYRDDYYNAGKSTTKIKIAKQRQGEVGTIEVMFDQKKQKYQDLARQNE